MESIKIIVDTSSNVDLSLLSREERKVFFEQLRENLGIGIIVAGQFEESTEEIIANAALATIPGQTDLLVRKLVNNGTSLGCSDNIYKLTPINTVVVPNKSADTKSKIGKPNDNNNKFQFDKRVLMFTSGASRPESRKYTIVAPNDLVGIDSLVIRGHCTPPVPLGWVKLSRDSQRINNYEISDLFCVMNSLIPRDSQTIRVDDRDALVVAFKQLMADHEYARGLCAARYWAAQNRIVPWPAAARIIPSKLPRPRVNVSRLRQIEAIGSVRFFDNSEQSVVADIDAGAATYAAYYTGVTAEMIDAYKKQVAAREQTLAREQTIAIAREKINVLRWLIGKRYGAAHVHVFDNGNRYYRADPLSVLGKAEARAIAVEYEMRLKFVAERAANTCPHKRAYTRMRTARDLAAIKREYNAVMEFADNKQNIDSKNIQYIQCKVCKFDLICPHVVDALNAEFSGESYLETRARMNKYADGSNCKCCGETIFSSFETPDVKEVVDEELSSFIWGEIMQALRFVRFDKLVDLKKVASAARDTCYPFIYDIDKQISRSKTNNADESSAKRKLYTTIYAYAYIIKLAANGTGVTIGGVTSINNNRGRHKGKRGGNEPERNANPIAMMIRDAIDLIMLSKNVIIRDIPGMNADVVKNSIITAYKSLDVGKVTIASTDQENILVMLLLDPVYWYYYRVNTRARGGDRVDNINRVLDTTIPALEKLPPTGDIFANAIVPKWGQNSIHGWGKYVADSFSAFDRRVKSRLYLAHAYKSGGGNIEDLGTSFAAEYSKYFASVVPLLSEEVILMQARLRAHVHAYKFLPVEVSRKWQARETPLGRLYDEQGRAHVWNIYRCASGADIKLIDITKKLAAGERFDDHVVDRVCSVCGVVRSAAGDLSSEKIAAVLARQRRMALLFAYYEHRCPVGGLHDGTPCSKCQLGSLSRDEYYAKYEPMWIKTQNTTADIKPQSIVQATPLTTKQNGNANFVYDYSIVSELAERLNINPRLLSALGSIERVEYSDVVDGAYTPAETQHRYEPRVFLVDTYVKNLLADYNQLRFFHRIHKPSYELSGIVEASGIQRHLLASLPTMLPSPLEFATTYNTEFAEMMNAAKPRDIVLFCIQQLCGLCMWVLQLDNSDTTELRKVFIAKHITRLFRSEELISKPGYFSMSILYGDKEPREPRERTSKESVEEADEESPMSMDAFDMEDDDDEIKIKDSYVDT